jgi:membrane protein
MVPPKEWQTRMHTQTLAPPLEVSPPDAPATEPLRVQGWLRLFRDAFRGWSEDKALRLAAAIAYYSVFSIAPLLVITIAIAGLVLGDEAATGKLFDTMKGYIGGQAAAGVQAMVESASRPRSGIIATVVGGATLLLGASGVLGQLKDALNTIWEVEVKKGVGVAFMIRSKFLNFGMVLVIGLLLLVSLLLSSFLTSLNQSFEQILSLPAWVWTTVASVVSLGVITTLFAMLFKVLPDACIRWRDVWIGALITAVLFEVGKFALGWYLGRESMTNAYGSAGSVVLLILWVYYASCILLFGAEFTQVYAAATGHVIKPSAHARVAPEAALKVEKNVAVSPQPGATSVDEAGETWTPQARAHRQREKVNPVFSHRLFDPVLKYLEGRGMLLSIEAKEALGQAVTILILAAVACVTLFVAWSLLAIALVGLLANHFDWPWVHAVALTGGAHLLVVIVVALLIWRRVVKGAWFAETFKELKKDRIWLRGTPH